MIFSVREFSCWIKVVVRICTSDICLFFRIDVFKKRWLVGSVFSFSKRVHSCSKLAHMIHTTWNHDLKNLKFTFHSQENKKGLKSLEIFEPMKLFRNGLVFGLQSVNCIIIKIYVTGNRFESIASWYFIWIYFFPDFFLLFALEIWLTPNKQHVFKLQFFFNEFFL